MKQIILQRQALESALFRAVGSLVDFPPSMHFDSIWNIHYDLSNDMKNLMPQYAQGQAYLNYTNNQQLTTRNQSRGINL